MMRTTNKARTTYTVPKGTACEVRRTGERAWRPHTTGAEQVFRERPAADGPFWTFRVSGWELRVRHARLARGRVGPAPGRRATGPTERVRCTCGEWSEVDVRFWDVTVDPWRGAPPCGFCGSVLVRPG